MLIAKKLIPAAEYVRVSADEQRYSAEVQRSAIHKYAQEFGYLVVRSYEDIGKSGVAIKRRKGLKALLKDVLDPPLRFNAILVYDVSRWGRFQDSDEAAYLEFLCRQAGAPVCYCAEDFANDHSVQDSILKAIKRTMASEFSRELSKRTVAGHRRCASIGFRPGGPPGFGLRRAAVGVDGRIKRTLESGERKPSKSDGIVLVPGPLSEVKVVRGIFEMYLEGKGRIKPGAISRRLNADHVPGEHGRPWTAHTVLGVLTYPKYVGKLVWGRTTQRMQSPERPTSSDTWTIRDDAFKAIIDIRTYSRAQNLLRKNIGKRIPDGELVRAFRRVYKAHGRISESLVGRANGTYSLAPIYRRFGSVRRLYDLVGYKYPSSAFEHGQKTVEVRKRLLQELIQCSNGRLSTFRLPHAGHRENLLIDGMQRLYVWMALRAEDSRRGARWYLRPKVRENDGLILMCLMQPGNEAIEAMYLFPNLPVQRMARYTFGRRDRIVEDVAPVCNMAQVCNVAGQMVPNHISS